MYFKEFEMPVEPKIPEYEVSVLDFGAKADGKTLCTEAIKKAIDACAEAGGGRVVFPKGEYLTGAIHLKDNIEVHFAKGSRTVFTGEKEAYLPIVFTGFEGIRCYNYSPLIYGYRLKNIAVTGEGLLYGSGEEWWDWKQNDTGINAIYIACMNDTPVEERVYGTPEFGLRPCMLQFVECENVLISDLRMEHAPFWTVHPLWCNNVIVRKLTLNSPFDSHNTDSINIEGCNRVLVEDCHVESGGDDIFTLKSGRGTDGWNVGKPCKDVIIRRCSAADTRGGGIVIGSEMSGGVENILAYDCKFKGIMNGIKIKSKKGRGGYVRNISYRNIEAENVRFGIHFGLKYAYDDQFCGNDREEMPDVCNLSVTDYKCNVAQNGVVVEGVDGCDISNVNLKNISITNADNQFHVEYTKNLNVENLDID